MNKPFYFKKFHVHQAVNAMKIGTDGVLLGAACSLVNPKKILDVGAGTGVISLMLAQRCNASIDAIEIDEDGSLECQQNFTESPWRDRLKVYNKDLKDFNNHCLYDQIVCNPPFFKISNNESSKRTVARSQSHLTYKDLIDKSVSLLNDTGILSVIIPFNDQSLFREICEAVNLHCFHSIAIKGRLNTAETRAILEFTSKIKPENTQELTIERTKRHEYTPQYLELMSDFLFLE